MKKLVSIILAVLMMLISIETLAETDLSAMTDEELEQLIQAAQEELNSRKASSDAAALERDGMVTVREAGFRVQRGKTLYYSFIAHNNLTDKAIKHPEFKIVVRNAKGDLISTGSKKLSTMYPGQDIMYGSWGMGMDVEGVVIASIEVEFVEPSDNSNVVDPSETEYPGYMPIEVESARLKKDGHIVGEFTNPNSFDIDEVAVSVLFRDDTGKLRAGETTYVNGAKAGKTTAFEINVDKDLTSDNYEVFAQPW